MNKIKQYTVTKNGKEYDCGEINISTEQWYQLLKEPKAKLYTKTLFDFLREPGHKGSCYAVATKYNSDPQSYNAKIMHLGKWVHAQLDFTIYGTDEKPTYWAIPMKYGMETKEGFVWQLRKELVEALQKLLIENLIDDFTKVLSKETFKSFDELYKWDLLQSVRDKSNLGIANAIKGEKIVYNASVGTVFTYLVKERPAEFDSCLSHLFDENVELNKRIEDFKNEIIQLIPSDWKYTANDERTVSALLTCKYPEKYTFYMSKVYEAICLYLGIEKQKTGKKFNHFTEIINGITLQYGEKVQNLINKDIQSFSIKPKNLAVQTAFWIMLDRMNQQNSKSEKYMNNKKLQQYIDLLLANHNVIFNGAPGTGKTYLAKEIAEEMGAKYKMVQFHPSYDYTDFVEGLRPIKDEKGNIGFERKDGVFKVFCMEALLNLQKANKTIDVLQKEQDINERLDAFITDAIENEREMETDRTKNKFTIIDQTERNIIISVPNNDKVKEVNVSKAEILKILLEKANIHSVSDIKEFFNRGYTKQQDSYIYVICTLLKKKPKDVQKVIVEQVKSQDFVFIIDEINRGEISKIFGELFYSIDPGYRGEKGKVQTQYQNLVEEGDVFKEGFYVPENVYIIGTMNDIDRSVESMDFAMRRRFAWQEITAEESAENMGITGDLLERMNSLNKIIEETEGLGTSYQVGAAMFLKVKKEELTEEELWNLNLKSLMKEYLRGMPDASKTLQKMEEAYFLKDSELTNQDN